MTPSGAGSGRPMTTGAMAKRFYTAVAVEPAAAGFAITLDGRPVRTPGGGRLILPSRAIAEAIAAEWDAQAETIRPHTMPITQLANTALDRVPAQRMAVRQQILAFAETDTLCYRADSPESLVERQQAVWQPLLDWAEAALGARLAVTRGIVAVRQEPAALARLGEAVAGLSDLELTVVAAFAACSGSLVVPLAVRAGRIDAAAAFEAALLDELFQVERWGEDAEAAVRRQRLREDMAAYARLLELCGMERAC